MLTSSPPRSCGSGIEAKGIRKRGMSDIWKRCLRTFAFGWTALAGVAGWSSAEASSFQVLYAFQGGNDGAGPGGGLIMDQSGNLYGTTSRGGGTRSAGVIFKLAPSG